MLTLLTHANVFDGEAAVLHDDPNIVIENDRIVDMGRGVSEFDLRKDVFTPVEVLRQATSINARLLQMEGRIGCIGPGAFTDIVVVDGDPLADLSVMTRGPAGMPLVMQGGAIVRNPIS